MTSPTLWWVFAILTATAGVGVYLSGWPWETIAVTVVLTALGVVCGLDDASRKLAPARGQYVQAAIIGVASICCG
ncbi:hypothetical protein ACTXG7_02105 [Mycolicibacterium sp. Dal123E01]|uniref:hypothetical protein n=1 Tax=Mycolicibacterium sp. Dal123E01 TaxID=3457578 RepID=UPI00403E8BFE